MSLEEQTQLQPLVAKPQGPSWMQGPTTALRDAATPVEPTLDALRADPHRIQLLVKQQPRETPRLLQQALAGDPGLAKRISSAMEAEFRASAGVGANADAMFRGALELEGDGAVAARAEVERWVNQRDEASREPVLSKLSPPPESQQHGLLERTARDPDFGKLYAAFFDHPKVAAGMLLDIAKFDAKALDRRIGDLRWMMSKSPAATQTFVHTIMEQQGPGASLLQTFVVRELHASMAEDLRGAAVIDHICPGQHSESHVRLDRLMPLLADIVSKPEVARQLVLFDNQVGKPAVELPTLRTLLTDMLRASYANATKVSVRLSITQGGADMLKKSVEDPDPNGQSNWGESAGTFLGEAARAEADVGFEEGIAESMAKGLEQLGKYTPGAPGKTMKTLGTILGFLPKPERDPSWTKHAVDELLQIIYAQVHPVPADPFGSTERTRWEDEAAEWRRVPAEHFQNARNSREP